MLTTFDIDEVRRFAQEVETERNECDSSDFCSDLDQHITCLSRACSRWQEAVTDWAQAVFRGEIEFDSKVEEVLKAELLSAANRSRHHVKHGREVKNQCHDLEMLDYLDAVVQWFDYLLKNWVSPQRSVMPAPRVKIPEPTLSEIEKSTRGLPPLPPDWRPKNMRQLRMFNRSLKS